MASTSATLDATIDPNKSPTSYYFQYGKSSEYESEIPSAPGASLGSGEGGVEVSRHVQHLSPSTVYHYRVVAVSELQSGKSEIFYGADQTFTTQAVGTGLALPDGRQWELVSPPDKHGALIFAIGQVSVIQSSATGDAITYAANSPIENGTPGYTGEPQIISTRGSSGWSSQNIALPHSSAVQPDLGYGNEYRFFSEDLSLSVVQPFGEFTSFSPDASPPDTERTPYLRHDLTCDSTPATCFEPLVTGAPGYANVPTGAKFGGENTGISTVEFRGATPDLNHVILTTEEPVELTSAGGVKGALYEWSAGNPISEELQSVSVLPEDEGGTLISGMPGFFSKGVGAGENLRGAISSDGSRVIWSTSNALYLRDIAKHETLRLDTVQGGPGIGENSPAFQIANSDDSVVFFTEPRQLTPGSGAHNGESDLYECEIIEVASKLQCRLSDLTPVRSREDANVQGGVLGTSKDGSYLYFVETGVLSGNENAQHERRLVAPTIYICSTM